MFAVLIVNMQYIYMCITIYKYQSLANSKLIFKSATSQKTTRLIHLHPVHRQVSPCGHRAIWAQQREGQRGALQLRLPHVRRQSGPWGGQAAAAEGCAAVKDNAGPRCHGGMGRGWE